MAPQDFMPPPDFVDVEILYAKNADLNRKDVKMLRDWAEKQPHLPEISELDLILFLHSCHYSNEATKKCMETYYTVRAHCPEFFAGRDVRVRRPEILDLVLNAPLSRLTPAGHKVIFGKLVDTGVHRFSVPNLVKNFDMTVALMLRRDGTHAGHVFVSDFRGFTLAHLARISVAHVKKFFVYFQEAMPVRVVGVHIINVPSFMDRVMALIRPFMKQDLFGLIQLHTGNFRTLFEYVPQECLPRDYGGDELSTSELKVKWDELLLAHADYFVDEERSVADETKRTGKPKDAADVFGMEGTFKKLDID